MRESKRGRRLSVLLSPGQAQALSDDLARKLWRVHRPERLDVYRAQRIVLIAGGSRPAWRELANIPEVRPEDPHERTQHVIAYGRIPLCNGDGQSLSRAHPDNRIPRRARHPVDGHDPMRDGPVLARKAGRGAGVHVPAR